MAKKKTKASEKKTQSGESESTDSFEVALEKLEQIARELESGQIGLSESLQKYEQGVKHLRHCYKLLDGAENKIQTLTGIDKDGNAVLSDFEHSATTFEKLKDAASGESDETGATGETVKSQKRVSSGQGNRIDDSNSLF